MGEQPRPAAGTVVSDKIVKLGAGMAFWGDRVQPAADMVERARHRLPVLRPPGRAHDVDPRQAAQQEPRRRLHPRPGRPAARRTPGRRAQGREGHQQRRRGEPAGGGRAGARAVQGARALRRPGRGGHRRRHRGRHRPSSWTTASASPTSTPARSWSRSATGSPTPRSTPAARASSRRCGLGADVVICGRVTDIALYLGPLIHEFGWAIDDWQRLGMATVVAHAIECGGQATGGLYAGGLAGRRRARGPRLPDRRGRGTTAPPSSPRRPAPAAGWTSARSASSWSTRSSTRATTSPPT